jgi:Ran GTPase-activating protein (RanGAP) involved in mRNA processing and transport
LLSELVVLPWFANILRLNLASNGLTSKSLTHIVEIMISTRKPPLSSINLSNNNFGKKGAVEIARVLESNNSLEHLYLMNIDAKTDGGVHIVGALRFNNRLATLDLSKNKIGDKAGPALVDLIKVPFRHNWSY